MSKGNILSIISTVILAIFCVLAASGPAGAALTDGLVLYLDFNEGSGTTAHDSSGYGNNGTLSGGATYASGISGSALYLDGTGSVAVPTATNLSLINDASTISFWFNAMPSSSVGTIFGGYSTSNLYSPLIHLINSRENAEQTQGKLSACVNSSGFFAWSPTRLDNGQWHNIVFTAADNGTSSTTQQLYVDGVLVATTFHNDAIWPWQAKHSIGKDGPFDFFTGAIDEFSIYSRVLSAAEVTQLYTGATSPVPVPPAVWLFGSGFAALGFLRRRLLSV